MNSLIPGVKPFLRSAASGLALAAAALSGPALGQEDEGGDAAARSAPVIAGTPWYVSPMLSTTLPDSSRATDQGYGGSIALGKKLLDGLALELSGNYTAMDAKAGGDSAKTSHVGLSALVFPSTNFPWVYGLLGAGYGSAEDHPGAASRYDSFVLETGVGLLYPVNFFTRFLLRADVRFRLDNPDSKRAGDASTEDVAFYDDVFSVGALFPLGPAPAPAAAARAAAASLPADSDNDGVLDANDRCPGTPAGAVVDEYGCEKDSDGDGVPDRTDQCPDTPKGVAVNDSGCPLDSDQDGIGDSSDECPNTPAGAKVLANGCTLVADCRKPRDGETVDANGCAEKKFVLRGVKFDFDSDRLTESAKIILGEVAETMAAYPDVTVELEGHTCNIGSEAYNLGLSQRRAAATKRFLMDKGVPAERMSTVGYGLTRPIDSNDSEAGRENNRRVEMKVTGGDVPSGATPATP